MKYLLLLTGLFFRFCSANSTNYIANGSFDLPVVPAYKSFIACQATGWTGQYFDLIWDQWLGRGQALDLQRGPGQNGYIEQTVVLPNESYCNLSFYKQGKSTNYNSFVLGIYWNGQLIATENTNTTLPTFHSQTVCGMQGNNNVRFQEKGNDSDYFGTIIDDISLTCDAGSLCMNHSVQPQTQPQP